jgi:hypothetical protein
MRYTEAFEPRSATCPQIVHKPDSTAYDSAFEVELWHPPTLPLWAVRLVGLGIRKRLQTYRTRAKRLLAEWEEVASRAEQVGDDELAAAGEAAAE